MNEQVGIVLLALACGIVVGLVAATRRRPSGAIGAGGAAPTDGAAVGRLEARLEVQAAELRRLADGAAARELSAEQLQPASRGLAGRSTS